MNSIKKTTLHSDGGVVVKKNNECRGVLINDIKV